MIDDEKFFAWLDGELAADEAGAVEAAVAADGDLQRRAAQHRALAGRLSATFDPVAAEPVQAGLRLRQADIVDLAAARDKRAARPISVRARWAAMAATLALGIVAGSMIDRSPDSPIASEGGQLVASGELEDALYTHLASAPADDGARIGLTFHDAAGDLCRSFTDQGAAGLACHQGGDWRIRGLFQAGEGQQSEFRMAAGPDPRLAELINSTRAGEPLDAQGERQAIATLR